MDTVAFVHNIEGYTFSFEKIDVTEGNYIFFITANYANEISFFMSKINDCWKILYHNVLGWDIIRFETELSTIIKSNGY